MTRLATWWVIVALSFGSALSAEIVGPAEVAPGDLAVFRVTPAATRGTWRVWPKAAEAQALPVLLADGGTALVFASRTPQTLAVIFAAPTEGGVLVLVHECRNGQPEPKPDPPKPDPPKPDPPKPDPPKPDPPKPDPPKPDPPRPDPSPVPGWKKAIVWIEETADRTPGHASAIADQASRQALAAAGWTFRVVDKDVVDERGRTPSDLAPILAAAGGKGLPIVFTADAAGNVTWYQAPTSAGQMRGMLAELGLAVRREEPPAFWPTRRNCPGGLCR